MIDIRGVEKVYGCGGNAVHALRGIDLEIGEGEFVAIMGRSGSGKSTLLHILGLLDRPTTGTVHLDGVDVLNLSESVRSGFRLKRLGYVFQEYSLLGELTCLNNVSLPARVIAGAPKGRMQAIELLKTVGLGDRLRHYPNQMSGGEQQRVAIARALVNQPRILFADEPTASLDATSAQVILELFQRLNQETGQTIVMVTHEAEDSRYVDRVIWLKDGVVDPDSAVSVDDDVALPSDTR
jgi:putative ABC transport system ATP-binding protein